MFAFDTGRKVKGCSSPQGSCVVGEPEGPTSFEVFADSPTRTITFTVRTVAPIACGTDLAFKASFDGATYQEQPALPSDNTCNASPPSQSCPVTNVSGSFEPVQAVWQDDPLSAQPHFADKPGTGTRSGKRLVQTSPIEYVAELPMVRGKPTLLFGIDHHQSSAPQQHNAIVIRGTTTGTTPVNVAMLFSGSGAGVQLLHETDVLGSIDLDGPCGAEHEFAITLYTPYGAPVVPAAPFLFTGTGPYTLTDELRREDGAGTGIAVTVKGTVVDTRLPTVAFVPMRISDGTATAASAAALQAASNRLSDDSVTYIPDFFPLQPSGMKAVKATIVDARAKIKSELDSWATWAKSLVGATTSAKTTEDALLASLADSAALGGTLGKQGRTVIVFDTADYQAITGFHGTVRFVGLAVSQKVVFVQSDQTYFTVAHELAHTMPYSWAEEQMQRDCDINYHNLPVADGLAHGFGVTRAGREFRTTFPNAKSFMGTASGLDYWIDQCTYWQLVDVLRDPPDPAVIVVRGRLARNGAQVAGELLPAYEMDGAIDLPSGKQGDWAIVARDAGGRVLGRYPFDPEWSIPDLGRERDLISFLYRIPARAGIASVDLEGPGGLLNTLTWSAHAPAVAITTPTSNSVSEPVDGKVHVTWSGKDPDGGNLLYSVLYSNDGGKVYVAQSVEQPGTSFDVTLSSGVSHRIRIVATDGARSAESTIAFSSETPADLVAGFVAAFRAGTGVDFLGRLDPAVIDRYGATRCEQYLAALKSPTLEYTVVSQTGPAAWKWTLDGKTTRIPSVFTLVVDRTEEGATTRIPIHIAIRSGQLSFFTDCGQPR